MKEQQQKPVWSPENPAETTHFGYRTVTPSEKTQLVDSVFASVASKYNLMNDVMSLGLHRLWKHFLMTKAAIRPGHTVLDVAAGTGDISALLAKQVGRLGHVVMTDLNENMLMLGRDQLINKGILNNISFVLANAEELPFPSHFFDCIIISFGLRNVTHKEKALTHFYRILKPGGKLLILEFSKVKSFLLQNLYDFYSFNIIPKIGKFIADDEKSYQYLVESIRMHPDQDTLKIMLENAQFEDVNYHNLSNGIVAVHIGYKY